MNIEKLAKHLKEFTLDEINMIAECDCETELETLLQNQKLILKDKIYTYNEQCSGINFGIFVNKNESCENLTLEEKVKHFLENYVMKYCSKKTNRIYRTAFKLDILPIVKKKRITNFTQDDIKTIYEFFVERNFKPKRIKNTMALLKQFLKYCKAENLIEDYTNFYVKRITPKNEFNLDRIIFE